MFDFLTDNPLLREARGAYRKPRGMLVLLLLFFLVRSVSGLVSAVPSVIYLYYRMFRILGLEFFVSSTPEKMQEYMETMEKTVADIMAEEGYFLVSLLAQLAVIVVVILYCRFFERRSLASMGLSPSFRGLGCYGVGLVLGGLLAGLSFLLLYATGSVTVAGGSYSPAMLLLFFFGFMIQGAAEEVLLRGYFMVSMTHLSHPGVAVVASAIFFSLMHNANPGITFLGFVNIFLFGLFLGLLIFRTGNLFMACALHGMWNFAVGNLFGMSVSGLGHGSSLLVTTYDPDRVLTNGGAFGPEGGAVVTVVLLLALAVLLLIPGRGGKRERI